MSKVAIVTGITGQDGAYLAKLLLSKNYAVIGITRSYTNSTLRGLEYLGIENQVTIVECDLLDFSQIIKVIIQYKPTEIYNLAAQSSVSLSFNQPIGTLNFNILSVVNLLEAIKIADQSIKFYQASTSEMFGKVSSLPINENTVFHPLSPYAVSKASAHWICINYRESYKIFTCCGILFNHESFLRSDNFFVKKVISQAINIYKGLQQELVVGNLDIKRDFGFAPKYVEAMYLMMQTSDPSDFLVCSGASVSLRTIVEYIFDFFSLPYAKIVVSPELFRPAEIEDIYGNNEKVKKELGWEYDMTIYDVLDNLIKEELAYRNIVFDGKSIKTIQ
jgi:GDPmannose 4,6-dehydratase